VEIWCDGGMRTAADVVKMICLGANRVGFGTLAMVAIGCTICRDCQSGTCHVGIASQIETACQAEEMGLKRFIPQDFERAVTELTNLFSALGEGVREITARLGFERTQDLVGRSDLLRQSTHQDRLDLREMLTPVVDYMLASKPLASKPVSEVLPREPEIQMETATVGRGPLRRPRNHLTTVISNMVMETLAVGETYISFEDDKVTPSDRALGTHLTGALTRFRRNWMWLPGHGGVGGSQESWRLPQNFSDEKGNGSHLCEATLRFYGSSVPGNGLGAYHTDPMTIVVEGGAQDGVAKGMSGGRVAILKGYNHDGKLIDGSVGKSLAYGATGGTIIVQGNADSRACVRLSGADVIIGGEIAQPLNDSLGFIGIRANVKGFLCEYMTDGRVLVLGDPGPWMCAGMTGGLLFLRLQPHLNFDLPAIQRRLAKGAKVTVSNVDHSDYPDLHDLLTSYSDELARNHQAAEARKARDLLGDWQNTFVKIQPVGVQEDQKYSTE
jgi:glutamate synthase (NADPH/NADH) large chain